MEKFYEKLSLHKEHRLSLRCEQVLTCEQVWTGVNRFEKVWKGLSKLKQVWSTVSCTLSKFCLPFHEATPVVHFGKALKRPRNTAGFATLSESPYTSVEYRGSVLEPLSIDGLSAWAPRGIDISISIQLHKLYKDGKLSIRRAKICNFCRIGR